MASTFNCRVIIEGVLNGRLVEAGTKIHSPFAISSSADTYQEIDFACTGASGGQQIATFTATPVLIYVNPKVAGVLAWRGSATDGANGSISLPANSHFLIPGGSTTADAASPELRSEAGALAIDQLWFDAGSDGKITGLAIF